MRGFVVKVRTADGKEHKYVATAEHGFDVHGDAIDSFGPCYVSVVCA